MSLHLETGRHHPKGRGGGNTKHVDISGETRQEIKRPYGKRLLLLC